MTKHTQLRYITDLPGKANAAADSLFWNPVQLAQVASLPHQLCPEILCSMYYSFYKTALALKKTLDDAALQYLHKGSCLECQPGLCAHRN